MSSRSPKHGFPHSEKKRKQCLKYRVLIAWSTHKALFVEWRNTKIWTNFITSGQILARGDCLDHRGRSKHSPEGATCTSFHKKKIRFPPRIFIYCTTCII
jgi:hypothetical protein